MRLCLWVVSVFHERLTSPSAKPPFLEDQVVSLSLATLLRPVRLGRLYQEHKVDAGIALERNLYLNTLFFADDQITIQDTEGKLQKSVYILNQLTKITISKYPQTKQKSMLSKENNHCFLK